MTDAADRPSPPAARPHWAGHAVVLVLFAALTALQYRPILASLTTAVPADAGDPLLNTWILWWNAAHAPWAPGYWHAPAFAPAPFTLGLSETLLGLTPVTSPLQWAGAPPILAYNIAFVLTPILNGMAAYALCLALCGRRDAAALGGLFFMMAPYRAAQQSHLQILAAFYMPLALLGLHAFWRSGHVRWLLLLIAATIGNGLVSGYHLVYFALALALASLWVLVSGAPARLVGRLAGALAIAVAVLAAALLPYMQLRQRWDLRRGLEEMNLFSADLGSFLTAHPSLWLQPFPRLVDRSEGEVYPGLTCLAAIATGALLAWGGLPAIPGGKSAVWIRRVRRGLVTMAALLAAAALVATVRPTSVDIASLRLSLTSLHKPLGASLTALLLATLLSPRLWQSARRGSILALYVTLFLAATVLMLGPDAHVMGTRVWYKAPLSWFVTLPGFDSLRVPARWATIQVLAGAVVIALVARRVIDSPSSFRRRWVPIAAGVAIAAEGWLILPIADLPPTLPAAIDAELVVELPSRGPGDDIAAMYRGIRHGARVVNGFSGHEPPHYRLLMTDIQSGCLASLDALRGGRSLDVVLHNERDSAAEIRQAIERQWPAAPRQDAGTVTRWHVDASPSRATTAYADPIELRGICPSRDDDRSASR